MAQPVSNPKFKRLFDTDFKLQVIQIAKTQNPKPKTQSLSIDQVCTDKTLGESAVRRWFE